MTHSSPPGAGLTPSERALIALAREQREADAVPVAVRERLLARARAETRSAEGAMPGPAALVPVRSRGAAQALAAALAMAAAVVLFARLRGHDAAGNGAEQVASGASSAARQVGARLFQSELFHAPAAAYEGPLPAPSANLFGEVPFSPQSYAWQARRWNDLGAAPTEPAVYEHDGGALCVQLGPAERIIAGWPWLPAATEAPFGPRAVRLAEPAPVPLEAGQRYQLVFKAWASDPLPEQLLIAVGHARLPFSGAGGARVELSSVAQAFVVDIVPRHTDPAVGVAFLASSAPGAEPSRVCVSDVTLRRVGSR